MESGHIDDLTEEDIERIMDVRCTDGFYPQAQIVKVTCPACGEAFLGTKRHAGGFIAGHKAYHEFENQMDVMIKEMGGT